MSYEIVRETPSVDDYLRIRRAAGLGDKSVEAAERGLPNTIFGVQVMHEGQTVAMCRLIGDGGCHYACVDAAVIPEHQGKGLRTTQLGKIVVGEVAQYFKDTAAPGAYLMAITPVPKLGYQTGFQLVPPPEVGMYVWQPMP